MSAFGRFFLPGPSEVRPEILATMLRPMISHRSPECAALFEEIQPGLQALFGTQRPVIVSASSATAMMEAGIRSLPPGRILALVNGAFSERFARIAEACGRDVDRDEVEWGQVHDPEGLAASRADYAGVTVVHSETSTGALQPIAELAKVVAPIPLLADAVSSLGATPIGFDSANLGFVCSGSQKALALPPGLGFAVTTFERRGDSYYLDLQRYLDKPPPFTPALPQIHALAAQLNEIEKEGAEARFERHRAMAERTWEWCDRQGLGILAAPDHRSPSVTCIRVGKDGVDIVARAATHGYTIGAGYGKLRETTFRIGHMGDQDLQTLNGLLAVLDDCLMPPC